MLAKPVIGRTLLTLAMLAAVTRAPAQNLGPAQIQTPPARSGGTPRPVDRLSGMRGHVFAADTGKPLRGAIVTVVDTRAANPVERQGRWIRCDEDGRWEALDLAPGAYHVSVSKTGYLKLEFGQTRPFERGKTLDVSAGQLIENVDVTLPRGAAITGRVFDEFGDPAAGVFVRVLRQRYVDGRRELTPLAEGIETLGNGGGAITDDLGQFRIHGLSPGDYYVSALFAPPGEAATAAGYPPVYYPGTASIAEARRIRLGIGEQAQNIDLSLMSARYAVVSGVVLNSVNGPASASIRLTGVDAVDESLVAPTRSGRDGTFTLRGVPPGDYRLQVYDVNSPSPAPELASVSVSVIGADVTGLVVNAAPGATARGRVVFEGGAKADTRLYVRSAATVAGATTFSTSSAGVNADHSFELHGLMDRQTFRIATLPEGWFLKAVIHEGTDITDAGHEFRPGEVVSGIDVVLTRRATTVSGTVQDDRGGPVGDYTVVAFSTDPDRWGYQTRFVRSARPDRDGRFTIRGLPPDEYFIAALDYVESGQEFDPDQLANWKTLATRLQLDESAARTVLLTLVR
jgi:hypothetical protein